VTKSRRQRVAAYADIRNDAGQLLLVQAVEAIGSRWFLPGGGVEFGEHPDDAVRREVLEETGLIVTAATLRQVVSDVIELPGTDPEYPNEGTTTLHSIRFIYSALIADPASDLRDEVDGSTVQAQWFDPAAIAALRLVDFLETYLASLAL
jgi:8-oxo-dGTP diphosphatase